MKNSLEDYLKGKLTAADFEEGLKNLFGSPHRRTKVLENPRIVKHSELLELAQLLDVQPLTLYAEYQVAFGTLTQREVEQLQFVFVTVASDKEAAIHYIEKFEEAALAA